MEVHLRHDKYSLSFLLLSSYYSSVAPVRSRSCDWRFCLLLTVCVCVDSPPATAWACGRILHHHHHHHHHLLLLIALPLRRLLLLFLLLYPRWGSVLLLLLRLLL